MSTAFESRSRTAEIRPGSGRNRCAPRTRLPRTAGGGSVPRHGPDDSAGSHRRRYIAAPSRDIGHARPKDAGMDEAREIDELVLADDPAPGVRRLTLNRPRKRNALAHGLRTRLFALIRGRDPMKSCHPGPSSRSPPNSQSPARRPRLDGFRPACSIASAILADMGRLIDVPRRPAFEGSLMVATMPGRGANAVLASGC